MAYVITDEVHLGFELIELGKEAFAVELRWKQRGKLVAVGKQALRVG